MNKVKSATIQRISILDARLSVFWRYRTPSLGADEPLKSTVTHGYLQVRTALVVQQRYIMLQKADFYSLDEW